MKYVAPEDIVVYSIDEVFMDITDYLPASGMTAREFARKIILDVMDTTGITATAGIGTIFLFTRSRASWSAISFKTSFALSVSYGQCRTCPELMLLVSGL